MWLWRESLDEIIIIIIIIIIIARGNIIISLSCFKITFLGQFAKLRKPTLSFVMSVRLTIPVEQLGAQRTDLQGI
jgi:hypothetical protein